jgi:hypothetical protein
MDLSGISDQLASDIGKATVARDERLEQVLAAGRQLGELITQQELLTRTGRSSARAYTPTETDPPSPVHTDEPSPPEASDHDAKRPNKGVRVRWPAGPRFEGRAKTKKSHGWATYKLDAADWYLSTLRRIADERGDLDRFVGVEMAIDGAVQALCSVFEAAVYALTFALEKAADTPKDRRTPAGHTTWTHLAAEATMLNFPLASASQVTAALAGEHSDSPQGWLAQLLILRHQSARHNFLVRHWSVGRTDPATCIDVPGAGPQPPIEYLTSTRALMEDLLQMLLGDIDAARNARLKDANETRGRAVRELPDLLSQARVRLYP